jgi:hypothetical protein
MWETSQEESLRNLRILGTQFVSCEPHKKAESATGTSIPTRGGGGLPVIEETLGCKAG